MLVLQRAFSQLRLVVGVAAETAAQCPQSLIAARLSLPAGMVPACSRWCSSSSTIKPVVKEKKQKPVKNYDPPSPYRVPGPRRYGHVTKYFTDGLLPREPDRPIHSLPAYKPVDKWNRKRALFGQNDFIDILGDGSLRPVDLLRGPSWLVGFRGNELQRLIRRRNLQGTKMKNLYPMKYYNMMKRIDFLYKKYNIRRGRRPAKKKVKSS